MASKKGAAGATQTPGGEGQPPKPRKPRTVKPKAADPDKIFASLQTMTFEQKADLHSKFSDRLREEAAAKEIEYKDHLAKTSKVLSLFAQPAGAPEGSTEEV